MHDKGAADGTTEIPDPGPQLGAIGVRRVPADGLDLGSHIDFFSEDLGGLRAFLDPPAERVLALESDKEH